MQAPEQLRASLSRTPTPTWKAVGEAPKKVLLPLWENRNPETEKPAREFVNPEGTKFQWLVGAKNPQVINPDNWVLDRRCSIGRARKTTRSICREL